MKNFGKKSEAPKKGDMDAADAVNTVLGVGLAIITLRLVSRALASAFFPPQPTQTVYYVVQPQQQTPAA
jgi:uncharacterized protein YbjT (DUF2867 family)